VRRKRLLILIFAVVMVAAVLVLHAYGVIGTGIRLEFQTLKKGSYGGPTSSGYYLINNLDEWTEVFEKSPQPEINFSKTTVIAVFTGDRNTGGFGIEIKAIIDTGFLVVVKVEQTGPGEDCLVTMAFTSPFHVVEVDKIGKGVRFDTIFRTIECD